MRQAS